ncbi:MAG: arsinothricin resistance N-acetyltransferase ArsN1 family B [Gammaproteobacteria bacterium]
MHIRTARPEDVPAINAIYRSFVTDSCVSFEMQPPSDADMAQRIAKTLQQLPWLVSVDGDKLLGYAYASRYRERSAYQWAAETTVYVSPHAQRCGIGRALYQDLFALLREQGYFTAYAGITLPNPASVGLHEALGFVPVGVYRNAGYKFGIWCHVGWWQRALKSPAAPPGPPMPFPAMTIRSDRQS